MSSIYYTSKLGNKYLKKEIEEQHDQSMRELAVLRSSEGNSICADCGLRGGSIWSSVNIGVFLCLRCGSLHRAVGTHISKPKGCTGSYLWGPDELSRMKEIGNNRSNAIYGGIEHRPPENASNSEWISYIKNKYEKKLFAPKKQEQNIDRSLNESDEGHKKANMQAKQINQTCKQLPIVPTSDLLNFNLDRETNKKMEIARSNTEIKEQSSNDFFASFGL